MTRAAPTRIGTAAFRPVAAGAAAAFAAACSAGRYARIAASGRRRESDILPPEFIFRYPAGPGVVDYRILLHLSTFWGRTGGPRANAESAPSRAAGIGQSAAASTSEPVPAAPGDRFARMREVWNVVDDLTSRTAVEYAERTAKVFRPGVIENRAARAAGPSVRPDTGWQRPGGNAPEWRTAAHWLPVVVPGAHAPGSRSSAVAATARGMAEGMNGSGQGGPVLAKLVPVWTGRDEAVATGTGKMTALRFAPPAVPAPNPTRGAGEPPRFGVASGAVVFRVTQVVSRSAAVHRGNEPATGPATPPVARVSLAFAEAVGNRHRRIDGASVTAPAAAAVPLTARAQPAAPALATPAAPVAPLSWPDPRAAAPIAAPAALPPDLLQRLTEQVVRSLDARALAACERFGRF